MTIIAKERKFIFVHIQKCGGTSIERAYEKHANLGDLILGSTQRGEEIQKFYKRVYGLYKHSSAQTIRDKLDNSLWSESRTIAVVRNPQKITESFYKWSDLIVKRYMRRWKIGMNEVRRELEQGTGRAKFFNWSHVRRYILAEDFQEYVAKTLSDKAQVNTVDLVTDEDGKIIVDDILKLECMNEIIEEFREITGIQNFKIGHSNKGSEIGPLVWDGAALERFKELNHEAYVRFGYDD